MKRQDRDWNIPAELVEATRTKGITFLVGAGASRDKPAKVPAWMDLANLLSDEIKDPRKEFDRDGEKPGKYIWKRIREDPKRRDWIIDRIREKAERTKDGDLVPSDLHRTIMHMASRWGGDNGLVLTTNYDLLLEAAAEQSADWLGPPRQWRGWRDGTAAAARGMYHLHGTLDDQANILLTDEEMEGHYAADGGETTKHLKEIFQKRIVLAVGYGFGDPEIGKVLDSISKDARGETYAIVEEEMAGEGRPRGLTGQVRAIVYTKGQHEEVKDILERIEEMAVESSAVAQAKGWHETGMIGPGGATPNTWKQIRELIVTGGANLEHFLRGTRQGSDADGWICAEMLEAGLAGVFRLKDLTEGERHLCGWLSLQLTGARLRKVLWAAATAGGVMHPELRFRLGRELQDTDRTFSIEDLRLGMEALGSQAASAGFNDTDAMFLGLIAERAQKTNQAETETGLEVLRLLTEVVAVPKQSGQLQNDMKTWETVGSVKAVTRSDGHTVEEAWEKIGDRLVEKIPERVWEIAAEGLRRQQRITDTGGGKRHSFNSWNHGLPAIEERDDAPDWRRGGSYVLVDAGCRALQKMGSTPGGERWWAWAVERAIREDSPLLRRIAVDSVRTTTHWRAGAKLVWAADQTRMNDWSTRHERYLLVKETWAGAPERMRDAAAKAIVEMVATRGQEAPDEKFTAYARADMIRWLQKQEIVHPVMEAEWAKLKQNDRDVEKRAGIEERPKWGPTAYWIGPNRPKQADELIDEWRRKGDKALVEAMEWLPPAGDHDWPNGPNLEGATKAVEEAIGACLEYGLEFSRILSERQRWDHWAWESLTRAMAKHLDTPTGRRWLEETEWDAITKGNIRTDWGEMLHSASKRAWDGEWSNETMEALYGAANRMLEATRRRESVRRGDTDGLGAMTEAINELEGKAMEAVLALWQLQVKREKASTASTRLRASEMVRMLGRLATTGEIRIQKYATVLLAQAYGLMQQEAPDVARQVVYEKLDSGDRMWRDVVWEGLAYCNHWNHSQVVDNLKERMRNDLMEQDHPPETGMHGAEKDQVADKYGYALAMKVWHENESYENGWQIGEMRKRRRQSVVRKICNIFRRTEAMHRDGWRQILVPVWKDIAGESGARTTEAEQKAWMACFRHLDKDEQREFANRFKEGPTADPEELIGHRDEAPSIANREAALEVLLHCCEGGTQRNPGERGFWKWQMILDIVQNKWRDEAAHKRERQLIDELLARHGRAV